MLGPNDRSFHIVGGEQQFTAQRITLDGCSTDVQLIWDWGWVNRGLSFSLIIVVILISLADLEVDHNSQHQRRFKLQPIQASSDSASKNVGHVGSISMLDLSFTNVRTGVLINPVNSKPGSDSTGVMIGNVAMSNVGKAVADNTGKTLFAPGNGVVGHWVSGPYSTPTGCEFSMSQDIPIGGREPSLVDKTQAWFERAKPQYENRPASDFVHLKDLGAKGNKQCIP